MKITKGILERLSIIITMFAFLLLTPALYQHVGSPLDEDVCLIFMVWIMSGVNLIIRTRFIHKDDKFENIK